MSLAYRKVTQDWWWWHFMNVSGSTGSIRYYWYFQWALTSGPDKQNIRVKQQILLIMKCTCINLLKNNSSHGVPN